MQPSPENRPRSIGVRALWPVALLVFASGCSDNPASPRLIPPLARVTISPETLVVRVGQSMEFTASAFDSADLVVNGVPFSWSSNDTDAAVITINRVGRVTGRGEGTALVFAEAGGVRDTAVALVRPASNGWFYQTSNTTANLNGVFFQPDGRTGVAVGTAGKIVKTTDAGVSWSPRVSGTSFTLNSVFFTTSVSGWAVGVNGTVLQTDDGGQSWTRVDAGASEALMDVYFATDSLGWVVGSAGVVLRTTDQGRTWQRLQPTSETLHSVSFAGAQDGWAVGDLGRILGTHDGGASWFVVQPAVTAQNLKAVSRPSFPRAFAVGAQGVAPRTVTPDTTRWELGSAGASNQLEGVYFPVDSIGFAVGYNGVGAVLRTDDAGISWIPQISSTQFRLNDVFFVDTRRGWAVGDNGTIIHTGTGGQP